jgi:hypothetical protein
MTLDANARPGLDAICLALVLLLCHLAALSQSWVSIQDANCHVLVHLYLFSFFFHIEIEKTNSLKVK